MYTWYGTGFVVSIVPAKEDPFLLILFKLHLRLFSHDPLWQNDLKRLSKHQIDLYYFYE